MSGVGALGALPYVGLFFGMLSQRFTSDRQLWKDVGTQPYRFSFRLRVFSAW